MPKKKKKRKKPESFMIFVPASPPDMLTRDGDQINIPAILVQPDEKQLAILHRLRRISELSMPVPSISTRTYSRADWDQQVRERERRRILGDAAGRIIIDEILDFQKAEEEKGRTPDDASTRLPGMRK